MPLLGNRLHVLNAIAKKTKKNVDVDAPVHEYIVPETREICSSEDELNRKKTIYESKIWTCRVTGRSALTHKEATKSEQSANTALRSSVEDHCRSIILETVHKNSSPLEPLVQACWTKIHEQFLVGEPILLKVDANKPIRATITEIDTKVDETEVIDLSKDENSSPNNSDKENSSSAPKKSIVIKKNYRYSVKLESDDPVVVNHVPSSCIQRIHRAPSKDHIRMYVRANAMRYGTCSSGPWIVDTTVLRKYCPQFKSSSNNLVDKGKLRQVSENYEIKYYEKILSERSKGNLLNGECAIKLSPKSLKDIKNVSVLRDDTPKVTPSTLATPLTTTENLDGKSAKKMKQATLHFGKSGQATPIGRKSKPGTPNKHVVLPTIAKRLIRSIKTNVEGFKLKVLISRCASMLNDAQVRALPDNIRTLVAEKKAVLDHKKKLQNLSGEEREAYLRDLRQQKRALVDENAPDPGSGVCVLPLPEPRAFPLPSGISSLQFGRVLGFTEFVTCYQSLLTENTLSLGEAFYSSRVRSLAADLCGKGSESDEEFDSDEEEEATLTSTAAGLPKASIRGLRRLSLDRVLQAVSERSMSASAYRCLTRPMSALLRLVFLNEQFSKQKELGIALSKIPITPYTAPELMRLLLAQEIARDVCSTNDRALVRINDIMSSSGLSVSQTEDARGATSLLQQLTSSDLFTLDPEHRILSIELLIEWMLDFDTMDDYMHATEKREADARFARAALVKQKRTVLPTDDDGGDAEEKNDNGESESSDLASIVKSRRVLAAKVAEEREQREVRKRERAVLAAKVEAEERAWARVEQTYSVATTEAKAAYRAVLLGTDRRGRRYWRFHCAPDRLFVEANWAPTEYQVIGDSDTDCEQSDTCPSSSLPPAHIIPPSLACCPAAARLGYAAYSRWYIFDSQQEMDALAGALVDKGLREGYLKKNLVHSGLLDAVKELVAECAEREKEAKAEDAKIVENGDGPQKTAEELAIDKITATVRGDARAILANVLMKNLYETEIHLRDGGLGGVPDFVAWQASILAIQSQFGVCLSVTGASVPSTPAKPSTTDTTAATNHNAPTSPLSALAEVLVAVGQHIHRRYLSVPKLAPTTTKPNKSTEGPPENEGSDVDHSQEEDPDEEHVEIDKIRVGESDVEAWLTAWVDAVRSAATLSRLTVLHACLDACILWEKSVANVRCRICRRNRDDESLLLCDGCNSGFHLYCLRPPLKAIPSGDWFCVSCKPPTTQSKSRSRRQQACETSSSNRSSDSDDEVEDDEGGDSEEEGSDQEEEEEPPRRSSGRLIHRPQLRQAGSRSSSRSSVTTSKPLSKAASASSLPVHHNDVSCLVCDDEGTEEDELIGCSTCPNAFHVNCHNPVLRSSLAHRRGNANAWMCSVCRVGKGASVLGHSLRFRANTRASRKNSYMRLHKFSAEPKKRPRPISDNESEEEEEESEDEASQEGDAEDVEEGEAEGVEASNDTEDTEELNEEEGGADGSKSKKKVSSPSAKRARTMPEFSCAELIAAVRRHRHSWPFQDPVDAEEVPDYYEIVVDPIDLSMVNAWHSRGRYRGVEGPQQLAKDLAKMFYNAELYNSADSDIWKTGAQLEVFVQSLFRKLSPPVTYKREKLN